MSIRSSDKDFEGQLGGHLKDYYSKSSIIRKDGYGEGVVDEFYADYTPKDINGTGKYFGKGPKNYVRSSDRVHDNICHIFTIDRALDASFIDVEVIGDEVHLAGFVDSRLSKWRAEDLAAEVPGVTKIINQLKIRNIS